MEGSKEEQVGGRTLNPKNAKGCDTKLGNPQDQAQTRPRRTVEMLIEGALIERDPATCRK
jgi:hypothetical protein